MPPLGGATPKNEQQSGDSIFLVGFFLSFFCVFYSTVLFNFLWFPVLETFVLLAQIRQEATYLLLNVFVCFLRK